MCHLEIINYKQEAIMATSSFINGMSLKNKEEVKRFCEILSSKPKNESRLEKVDYEDISGRELLNLLKNNK